MSGGGEEGAIEGGGKGGREGRDLPVENEQPCLGRDSSGEGLHVNVPAIGAVGNERNENGRATCAREEGREGNLSK